MTISFLVISISVLLNIIFSVKMITGLKSNERHHALMESIGVDYILYESVFAKNMPIPAWCKSASGKMLWINQEYETIFGIPIGKYKDSFDTDFWDKDTATSYNINDDYVLSTGDTLRVIESIPNKKGVKEDWIVYKFPVKNRVDNTIAVGGICFKKI